MREKGSWQCSKPGFQTTLETFVCSRDLLSDIQESRFTRLLLYVALKFSQYYPLHAPSLADRALPGTYHKDTVVSRQFTGWIKDAEQKVDR